HYPGRLGREGSVRSEGEALGLRAPRAGFVRLDIVMPIEKRLVEPPRGLRLVGVHEKRLIAGDEVLEQGLVGFGQAAEDVAITEMELLIRQIEAAQARLAGRLHLEPKRETLIRLETDSEHIVAEVAHFLAAEELHGRALEEDGDLRQPLRQPLSGAEQERHALPPPVLDEEAERDVRLGP